MKIGRLNRASFAKTARRAMFLFAFAVLGTQAATGTGSVDFAAFVDALKAANNTFDGSKHALAQGGKLTVKWSPVSGCYDKREGHECTVGNVAATANTPKRVNSGLTQFQLFEGESHAVNVKNVAFVYEPAAFTVCENSDWKGSFTAEQAPAGQIYLMNTGDVTFEGCTFDKVVLTSFNCTGTSTVKDCSFKDVYNSYAVKDIRGAKVAVTGCTFENCGAAVMVSSEVKVGAVTISGNTFKNVDVAGTAPESKVGTRGLVQIASSGDYAGTAFDFSDNKATDCGPVLRQLNETVSFDADDKTNLGKLVSDGGASTFYTDDTFVAQVGDTKYATLAEAITDVQNGETIVVNAGEYKLNGNLTYTGKAFTIQAAADAKVSFDMSEAVALHDAKITFSGVTFDYKTNKDYTGLQHTDTLVYNDCTVNGKVFLYAASETFNRCTFVQKVEDYNVWTYGAKSVTFNDCTFKNVGKTINAYIEGGNASSEPQKIKMADCTVESSKSNKAVVNIKNKTQAYDITLTGKNEVSGIAVNETTKSAWYQVETTDSTDQSCKAVSVTEVKDDGTKDVVYVVKPYVAAFVTVTGIAGFADRKYASFAEAYAAIKPTIEKLGLVQESATADAFDALFTSVDANGNATLTYTISGTVVYDETDCANLLTMGRKASHYGNGRHLINFKFVGATGKEADTLTVNSDITLPYEWWSEKTMTGIHFENLTITGSAPSGLYPSQKFFEGIDFSVTKCALKGIKIYNCSNVKGSYTITDSVLDGTGAPADSYAIHLQGNEKAPLSINIKGNTISGYDRGINIDQKTAVATIERNTISVKDAGRSCIQLSSLATADIVGNTLELTGGNAITLHENLLTLSAAPKVSISGNTVTGTGYLIYDDAKANDKEFTSDNLKLTYATDNTIAETVDTTKGVKGSTAYITSTAVNNEVQHYVAQVGTTGCTTLAAAFAALSAENHTLALLNEGAWDAATPVYWAAGAQNGYVATLTDALTAAYKVDAGAITVVCRPGADVGEMTHGHVADDLTIYGNDAYLSGGECDLEVDTYTFSRATGKQAADGVCLDKDITITAYELDNLGVWGERHTAYTVTVNLTDCDGKALEGKTNLQRVYISGTTGVNNITLTGCDFLTKATAVYSNADGAITAVNCSFTGGQVPFNINHKANGTQTVAVENCTFTNCGDAGDWKQFAAPLRLVNSGAGTQSAEVTGCAFAGTVGANGDILLGDGRTGQASNDVELKVVNTAANIQAQKPGYYGGETVDATKMATATSPADGTLETSVAKLLPVDPRTLGYATSGKAEALPAAPDMSGEVVNVTAAQAQYVLDGAYGPIDGKTINFTESINDTLILGRASKYDGSGTVYRHGSHDGEALSYADFIAYKNQSVWTESCYYERTVENVTFTANEGVTVKNFEADGGAHIYAGTAPVYDYVRDTGSWVTEGSCYFKRAILKNITFKGLTFKAKTDINTSESTTVYDGFTFKDCTFDLGTTADGNQAIRYYNENNNGNVKNLVVEGCTFKTCSQGVYTAHVKNVTVTGSTFDTTGHNAIAIQDFKGACDHGEVVITGNTFKGIGDRIIRFNNVGLGTTVTIKDNTADGNSGKLDEATGKREIVKATTLPVNAADSIKASGNNWGANTVVEGVFIDDYATKLGTEACPYSREQFAAMTRAEYITAQKRLGGTLYVNVGDYAYEKDGVLGNGVRDNTPGQVPDHSKLNAYGENGYLGEGNDGANGHAVVFVGGTITSGVTGYTSIDSIGTSLLLAVPAYTKVTFKETAFKNVLSFDYQLYTSPWSQLGGLTFNGCTFDGIIVGAIASQELAFNGCTFNNYVNTTSANSSNPTWIRPAYGNWTKGDNESQGTDFRSLTKITFENNTVTSTRPVKFERIAQWEMATTVRATDNAFDITPQEGDTSPKNVGLYFGANAKFDLVIDKNKKSGETAALYTAEYLAPTEVTYVGLPAGSTVKNAADEEVATGDGDALAWKTTDKITLKTTTEVASVTNAEGVSVNFATLADAIAAAKDGETVKLLADVNGDGIAIAPNTFKTGLTVDFGGHTYTVGGLLVGSSGTASNGFQLNAGNKITFKNGAIVGATATAGAETDWKGAPAILIQNYCDLTLEQMTVKGGDETCYTLSNNNGEIVIDGSTIVAGKGTKLGPFAFDVCRYAGYPSVHVTVKGASVIEGDVEISGTIGDNQSRQLDIEGGMFKGAFKVVNQPANIAISGGTFSSEVPPEYCAAGFIPAANGDGTFGVKEGAFVAEIGTVKYATVDAAMEAAAANETATTVKLLAESVDETVVPTWYIKGDVTVDADSAVKATFAPIENAADAPDTDGMAYIASDDAEKARTITVGEKVTLSFPNTAKETGAFYIGYGKDGNWAPTHLVLNGRIEAYEPYIGAGSSLTVSKTGSLKSLSECLLMRRGSTVTVTGTDGAWSAEKPQIALGYGSQQGGEVTFKDTFVTGGAFWTMWNRNGNADVATKLTLDNTAFTAGAFKGTASSGETSAYQVELKNGAKMTIAGDFGVIAEGSVTVEAGSLIIAKAIANAGTFIVDATGITAPVKVFDYTGTVEMTLADYGTVNVVGGEAYVEDGDLWVRELPVAKIGETVYGSLAEAVKAAKDGETVTLLDDTVVSNVALDKSLTLDFNGKTVSSESGAKVLTVTAGTITIKNGTIQAGTVVNVNSGSRYSGPAIYVTVGQSATEKEIALTLENMTVLGIENQKRGVTAETMEDLVAGGMCKYEVKAGTAVEIYSKFDTAITVNVKNSTIRGGKGAATEGTVTEYLSGGANQADGGVGIYARGENLTLNIMEGSRVFGGDSDNKNAGVALDLQKCASVVISDSTVQGGNGYGIAGSAVYSSSVVTAVTVENSTLKGGDAQTSWNGAGIELTSESPTITIKDSTVIGGQGPGNAKDPKGYAIDSNSATTTDKITLEGDVTLKANDKATVVRKTALGDPGFTLKDATVTIAGGALENVTVAVAEGSSQAKIRTSGETATVDVKTVVSSDDTKTLSDNGNGTFTFEACIARVTAADGSSSRGYLTFIDALAAADAGATVKMLADVVLTEKQTIAKALVLDLNGKTISSTVNQFITIAKGGDLTVNDATGEGRIENTVTESWGGTIKMTGGVLTVNGGTIAANSATSEYSPTIEADTSSSATINVMGGRIEADRTGNARAINLRAQANVTLNVTGGEIVGSQNGIYSFAGNTINISAGVVAGKAGSAVYSSGKNRVLISGGTLTPGGTASALYISMGSSATVTIGREGGKVDDVTIPSIDVGGCATTVTLLSGTVRAFKNWDSMTVEKVSQGKDTLLVGTDITACLPGSDLLCQLDAASGLYEIVKLTVENAAAIVTHDDVETPYHTVEQACKAVTDGDTLTLKVDHTGSQTLSFSAKNVTVDLGGKTLTYTGATGGLSSALSFNQSTASDNTVTVKNGTIVAKAQDAACVRAEMTGDLSKTLTVVFGENLTLTSGNTSRYGGVVFGTGARTASPCEKMTKGGLLVTEGEEVWIYGETATAFTHAKGSEVTLLNDWYDTDTKGTVKVPSSGTFASAKLNLNGHTINSYGVNPAVLMGMVGENEDTAAKTLEISSGTIKTFRHGAAVCGSNKTLTLDGVTLTTTGDKMYGLYANGTTSGNTVTLKNKSAVLSEKATGIYFPGAGTLTVEDSNVTGGVSGIEVRAGVLNVSGTSVIESTATAFDFTNNDNGITTTGAAVAAVKHTVGNDLTVTITGGTFKGPCGFYANDPNVAKPGTVTVSISGGVFSTDVEKKYLADGCKTIQQTINGTLYYVVGPAITQIGVTLGGKKKEMPFPDAWLADNIGADASSWTTAALEEKAANELAKWQCYLFGLDPNKEDAKVVATAGQGTDETIPLAVANADASASPLVTGGYVTVAYVLMGSNDGTAWTQVATSNKRDGLAIPLTGTTYKFYRVDVTVTSAEGN